LMLRCVNSGQELVYSKFTGARLRGQRPTKLTPYNQILRQQEITPAAASANRRSTSNHNS
jgi:hypothetical protein